MPRTDLSLAELRDYRPQLPEPDDLTDFWRSTLADAAAHDLAPELTPVDSGLVGVETWDVAFSGFGGHRVRAWLHLPTAAVRAAGPLAGVVQFQGYNGGRGLPHEHVLWASAGYGQLVMDTRGQGSGWTVGATPDPVGAGPAQPGFLTRGIDDPADHYYRRVFTDATRAVEMLRRHPLIDPARVCVTGASQGGGIALAVAALVPGLAGVMPDVPFLCDFPRAVQIATGDPYAEVARYLGAHRDRTARALATLAYFDGAVLARRATAPALFSVAMMDQTCPPSTVFAAYHAYSGPRRIEVYEYNDHEGGEGFQQRRQLDWLRETLGDPTAPGRTAR